MAFARDVYTATASQTDFTITYSYQDQADVEVYQNGSEISTFTFPNATTVRLNTGATSGDTIVLQRNTSQEARDVDFTAGPLTEADLDNAVIQVFYMAQEAIDQVNISLKKDSSELWDAGGTRIINVGTPTESTDAVTKAYADAISAAAGNVPTPGNPGEDDYFLKAGSGTWAWTSPSASRTALGLAALAEKATIDSAALLDSSVVETAKLNDNAVTLAKMEHGTSGDLLYYGASGAPTRLSAGTSGQSLVMGASYPEWGGGTPTGSVTAYAGTTAPTGWLLLNGDTLAKTSGGTHNGAEYEVLYELLWDNFADSEAAVSSGRGASAQADFDANKTITLPDATGRSIFGKEASATRLTSGGAGVDGATMGDSGGAETAAGGLPSHSHSITAHNPAGTSGQTYNAAGGASSGSASFGTTSAGSSNTHTNLSPALILSWIIKV